MPHLVSISAVTLPTPPTPTTATVNVRIFCQKKVIKMKDKWLLLMLNYCLFNRNDSNIATLHVGIEKHYIYKTKDRNCRGGFTINYHILILLISVTDTQ